MNVQTVSEVRAHLVSDLHDHLVIQGGKAHRPVRPVEECASCNEVIDDALKALTTAGWLDRLIAVEPLEDFDAIVWAGTRWVPAESRPDLDPTTELSVVMNAVGWALYGEDGRERSPEDGSIQLNDAEMEQCAAVAQRALLHLEVLRTRASIDPGGVLVIADVES